MKNFADRLLALFISGLIMSVVVAAIMAPKPTRSIIVGTLQIENNRAPAVVR